MQTKLTGIFRNPIERMQAQMRTVFKPRIVTDDDSDQPKADVVYLYCRIDKKEKYVIGELKQETLQ